MNATTNHCPGCNGTNIEHETDLCNKTCHYDICRDCEYKFNIEYDKARFEEGRDYRLVIGTNSYLCSTTGIRIVRRTAKMLRYVHVNNGEVRCAEETQVKIRTTDMTEYVEVFAGIVNDLSYARYPMRVREEQNEEPRSREEKLSIRRARHALKIAARTQAVAEGLFGAARMARVRRLYQDMLENTREQRLFTLV